MPEKKETKKSEEIPVLKGKYISLSAKRKTSLARVRLYKKGNGIIVVNGLRVKDYFNPNQILILKQPLKLTGRLRDYNFSIITRGGGKKSQAEAIRYGIAKLLVTIEEDLKPSLKTKGWLTRDARKKERKKPGLKKARRAPQWSKR